LPVSHLSIGILQGALAGARPPATAQGFLLNLTRATIALAFYPSDRGGFSTARLVSNRGEQANFRQQLPAAGFDFPPSRLSCFPKKLFGVLSGFHFDLTEAL
jgi:hypothetical protein